MIELTVKGHRREPMELQLTAMIDIFSMIVIFLIFGTVFGAAEIVIPPGLAVPRSVSKESVESAPRLVIEKDSVSVSALERKFPLRSFRAGDPGHDALARRIKADLKDVIAALPSSAKGSGVLLNVIADENAPYQDVFDVVKVFREAGFETLLFVATGSAAGGASGGGGEGAGK